MNEDDFEEVARLLSRNSSQKVQELSSIADTVTELPALMKAKREAQGLSMLAVAKTIDVPMMTYRRFELGECDRLRIPHIANMLKWLGK